VQILKELWAIKDDLSEECGHDLRLLFDKLKAAQKTQSGRIVNRTRQRPEATVPRSPERETK